DVPVLVDADGLTLLAEHHDWLRERRTGTLLTPHVREFARLMDSDPNEVAQDRLGFARRAAAELGSTVLLKGTTTVVAAPDGRAKAATLDRASGDAAVLAVVKADGYGHGITASAQAALDGGATWLCVAFVEEALALRDADFDCPVIAWLAAPGEDLRSAIAADVDLSASAPWALHEAAHAAREAGQPARVHVKADTGLSRAGATTAEWPDLVETAAKLEAEGVLRIVGVWSHFAHADAPGHPTTAAQ